MNAVMTIHSFLADWPDAEFGPAHIVLSDHNLEDGHIHWCLGLCRAALSGNAADLVRPIETGTFLKSDLSGTFTKECGDITFMNAVDWYRKSNRTELAATILFLEYLLTIPVEVRERVTDMR